ncbi:MAG: DUF6531 domain-containing protein, partial [Gammaproteobacteria bacterium]
TGELYDPSTQSFTVLDPAQLSSIIFSATPVLAASLPLHNSINIPIDSIISVSFSKSLRPETVNSETVTLSGPKGIEQAKVVVAENGMLGFITPDIDLLPNSTYSVTINGAVDKDGLLVPVSGISFSTQPLAVVGQPSFDTWESRESETESEKSDDYWEWKGRRNDGKPHSNWQDLPPLMARPGITALAGQVLDLKGRPLAKVVLKVGFESSGAQTDETGRFLIENIEAGWGELIIDGREARRRRNDHSSDLAPPENHGVFEYGLKIKEGETNVLAFTIWLPKIDTQHTQRIPAPTTSEVIVTNPKIPGLELHIPPGTTITDHEGKLVREVSLTRIPLDRTPFPLPKGVVPPVYFTAQPGGAYLQANGNVGARIYYPNNFKQLPGGRHEFWHYDTGYRGWYVYGLGTVTEDGKQIIPDPGISIYEFTGAMAGDLSDRPEPVPPCPHKDKSKCEKGDPVNLATGLFILRKTDLYVPDDIMPISFTRTYRPRDTMSRAFGIGTSHSYDMFVAGDLNPSTFVDLILPDGERVHYDRTSPGTGLPGAVFENTTSPTRFYKSVLSYNSGFKLALKDGTEYSFPGVVSTAPYGTSG